MSLLVAGIPKKPMGSRGVIAAFMRYTVSIKSQGGRNMQFLIMFIILCVMSYLAIKFIFDKFKHKINRKTATMRMNMHAEVNRKTENNKIEQTKITSDDINKFEVEIKNLITKHRTVMTAFEQYANMHGKSQAIMLFKISYKENITADEFMNNIFKNEKKFIKNKCHA